MRLAVCRIAHAVIFLALPIVAACGDKIGDGCHSSIDCSITGGRQCDISQPGGYCTVEACDNKNCPDESICVRFYPTRFLSQACSPATDPAAAPETTCAADEVCLSNGLCAPRASERRFCALKCSNDGDCRDQYECRLLGTE